MALKSNSPRTIESIPNFEGMVTYLKAGLKDGYQEVQEKFGDKAPTLQEYIEKVQRRFMEILEEKSENLVQ